MTPAAHRPYGILAEFDTPAALLRAAERVRDEGYKDWDVFTPFPIHGMDRAMGVRHSIVGWFAFIGATLGFSGGILMVWWMNAINYPLIVGGKPLFSPHPAIPPAYELAILLGSFGALFGMLYVNRLPRLHHPLLKNRRFRAATNDRFFLVIETSDPKYSETKTRQLLESLASRHIQTVEED